ncbi:unnamed protein product [Microthlaspi erraticum]|uniref:Secreted protein n=1 Tax=Microthlaspi erraticum TaxID=1685480 RepID=A0A6D2LBL4_9BRAS|nr:unnamed protein product [Microthlaspi erraticum]
MKSAASSVARHFSSLLFLLLHLFLFLLFVSSSGGSISGGIASSAFESLFGLCRSPAFLCGGLTRGGVLWLDSGRRVAPVRFSVVSPSMLSFARQISAAFGGGLLCRVVPTRSTGCASYSPLKTSLQRRRFRSAPSSNLSCVS